MAKAKKKAPPRPPVAKKATKKKAAKKPAKRKPSASRGACAAAEQKWGRNPKQADRNCEADQPDHTAFGEVGGEASKAARELTAKLQKRQAKIVGGRIVK